MKFNVNQADLQKSLNYCQGVIEKRSTLPILSNVLLEAGNSNLTITATDLDLIFIHKIKDVKILEEGKTTTQSSIMYDIVRKFSSGKKINFSIISESKIHLESEKSVFNLNCINPSEFPLTDENFDKNNFIIKSKHLLKLLKLTFLSTDGCCILVKLVLLKFTLLKLAPLRSALVKLVLLKFTLLRLAPLKFIPVKFIFYAFNAI